MKNFTIAALSIVGLLLMAFLVARSLSTSAEHDADRAFAAAEAEEKFEARFPPVATRNESASRLEVLAAGLELDLRSPQETGRRGADRVDPVVMQSIADWIRQQHERPDDSVEVLTGEARAWLAGHREPLDAVVEHLVTAPPPRWPLSHEGARSEQPLPNLLGHMKLGRVLSLAALDAEERGEHERAWRCQQAAWKLAQGLYGRPEVISQLIGIASVRMIAATARKLEAPVPAWFAEVTALRPREALFDAMRFEFTSTRRALQASPELFIGHQDGSSLDERIGGVVLAPVLRWAAADIAVAAAAEMRSLRTADPCKVDAADVQARIRARTSRLTWRFSNAMFPNLTGSFTRAANLELALEGTSNILALKAARAASGELPAAPASTRSVCREASWEYAPAGAHEGKLRFTGAIPEVPNQAATKIPAEFRFTPPAPL